MLEWTFVHIFISVSQVSIIRQIPKSGIKVSVRINILAVLNSYGQIAFQNNELIYSPTRTISIIK